MSALRSTRRRRTVGAFAAGVLSLAAVPIFGFVAVDALRNSKEGQNAIEDRLPAVSIPPTPGVLFATVDDENRITSMSVLALAPPRGDQPARGGTAITVPVTAETTLSSGEIVNVADAYTIGGVEELHAATEGMLGVTLADTIVADEATISSLLGRVAPLTIELPADVHDTNSEGDDLTLFTAGVNELDANDIAALLLAGTDDDVPSEVYERSAAVWAAIAERVGGGIAADGTAVPPTTLAAVPSTGAGDSVVDEADTTVAAASTVATIDPTSDPAAFIDAFFTGPVGSYRLAGDPAPAPDAEDRTRINQAETVYVMATVMPGSISPSFASITFFVRSPLGDPGLTLEATAILGFAGANVVLVKEDSSIPIPPTSTLEVVDEGDIRDARRFVTPFGTVEEVEPQVRIDGVDAILTLGESFRTLIDGAVPPTTTASSETTVSGSEG